MIHTNLQSGIDCSVIVCLKLYIHIRCTSLSGSDHHKIHTDFCNLLPIHNTIVTGYIKARSTETCSLYIRDRKHRYCYHCSYRCSQNTNFLSIHVKKSPSCVSTFSKLLSFKTIRYHRLFHHNIYEDLRNDIRYFEKIITTLRDHVLKNPQVLHCIPNFKRMICILIFI